MFRDRTPTRAAWAVVGVLLGACGDDAPAEARLVETTDSAGITIVTSTAALWEPDDRWTVGPEAALSIGVAEGDEAYQLFRVSDAMRLPDGRIVVADAGTRDTRLFDRNGSHLLTVGGPGEGPEEYRVPTALLPHSGGGFTVVDFMDRVHYDADGEFLGRETFDRQRWSEIVGPLGLSEGGSILADGTVLSPIYGTGSSAGEPRPGPPFRPPITVALIDPHAGTVDTLSHIGGALQQRVDVGRDRPMPIVHPFAPSGRWFAGRHGTVMVYDGALPQVERIEPDGRHVVLRWTGPAEPVTDAEFEAWKEQQRNASWTQGQLPELERGWAAMDPPGSKARVSGALPSADGSTWVRLGPSGYEASEPAEWRIFGADGAWLGSVTLPGTFRPTEAGADYVLGVDRDPVLEVETVRLFAVEKP